MKSRFSLTVAAIVIGLIASGGIYSFLRTMQAKIEGDAQKIDVYVAEHDLVKDSVISDLILEGKIKQKQVPRKYVSNNSVFDLKDIDKAVLLTDVDKGAQITRSMLLTSKKAGLSHQVPEGKRAISVKVDEVRAVSEKIVASNRVDVVAFFKSGPGDKEIAKTVLQNILVVESSFENQKSSTNGLANNSQQQNLAKEATVVLAVSLQEAEKLVFAVENGEIYLALRSSKKEASLNTAGYTIETAIR